MSMSDNKDFKRNFTQFNMGVFAHPAKKVKLAQVVVAPIWHSLFPECWIRESRRQSIKVYRCLFRAELKFTD